MTTRVLYHNYERVQPCVHVRPGEITYGELPRAPSESLPLSIFRIRIAIARAAVVNTILINRNNWQVAVSLYPHKVRQKSMFHQWNVSVI